VTVYLVGAGPGDPELLTVKGDRLLRSAQAVVYDRLTAAELLDWAPAEAERVSVGKNPAGRSTPQAEINALLVDLGSRYDTVVRLKGGDPFVFARGSEEAEALAAAGIEYEVVPGITSAIAAPAYAGIPVTERYTSTSFCVITGHEDPTKATPPVDWSAAAALGGTLVILMGARHWDAIREGLIAGGLDPQTPVAAVRWGTTSRQESRFATLAGLSSEELRAPVTIVVGAVARSDRPLAEMPWFDPQALRGADE
jgi:uroporphyrin-III C-methyltransferase